MTSPISRPLSAERKRIEKINDIQKAGLAASEAIAVLQQEVAEFAALRASLFQELRTDYGWSLGDIANEYGVTRARVAQITAS